MKNENLKIVLGLALAEINTSLDLVEAVKLLESDGNKKLGLGGKLFTLEIKIYAKQHSEKYSNHLAGRTPNVLGELMCRRLEGIEWKDRDNINLYFAKRYFDSLSDDELLKMKDVGEKMLILLRDFFNLLPPE